MSDHLHFAGIVRHAPLVRVEYDDGVAFLARDLRLAQDDADRRAALHVAAHHGTWGIVVGLQVAVLPGNTTISVTAGAGYLRTGEPVVLEQDVQLAVPVGRWRLHLVPTLAADRCERPTTCTGYRPPVLHPTVALAPWDEGTARDCCEDPGLSIPLARVERSALITIDSGYRQVARAQSRPAIVSGRVPSGTMSWDAPGGAMLSTSVDTSSARLPDGVLYFATLVDMAPIQSGPSALGPLIELTLPTSTSFRLIVRAGAQTAGAAASVLTRTRAALQLAGVIWHAVLPSRGPNGGWS